MDHNELEVALCELATHLHERRTDILEAWSRAAEGDPKLTTPATLSRAQFYDHMPSMLDALESKLRAKTLREKLTATRDETANAAGK